MVVPHNARNNSHAKGLPRDRAVLRSHPGSGPCSSSSMCDDSCLPPICGIILYGKKEFSRFLIGFISPSDALLQKFDLLTTSAPLSIDLRLAVMYLLSSFYIVWTPFMDRWLIFLMRPSL